MTDMRTLLLGTVLASALVTPALGLEFPAPGDITGTWLGEMKCKVFDGENVENVTLGGALFVVQDGTELIATTDLVLDGIPPGVTAQGGSSQPATMCGTLFPKNPDRPEAGVGALSPVGANGQVSLGAPEEFQAAALKTKTFTENSKGETGKLTGKGILRPGSAVGSCRWKVVRVDPAPVPLDTFFCLNEPS
jgi:hypothetical protein